MKVAVVGAGSWGTAVAALLGGKGYDVTLWARSDAVADGVVRERHNPRYLSDVRLPDTVTATTDEEAAVRGADVVVIATPSQAVRDAASIVSRCWDGHAPVVSLAKGLERETLLRMTEVLAEVLGSRDRLAALSGPNHAEEVSLGVPSATVVAAYDQSVGEMLQDVFMTRTFRVYTNADVIGVELAGASKNVVAVAAGMADGLGYGDNSKASLMTRGLAEMARLGRRAGADPLTYMGLAGVGDLIATCTSRHSRNRGLGELVAQGGTQEEFYDRTHMIAEGAVSCVTVDELGARVNADAPITHLVRGILYEGVSPAQAVEALLTRPATDELHGLAEDWGSGWTTGS